MDLDAVTEDDILVENRVGMDDAVPAELTTVPDHRAGMQRRSIADDRSVTHVGEGVDRYAGTDQGGRGNPGLGMDARPARFGLADQMGTDGQKRGHRVIDFDDGEARAHFVPTDVEVRARRWRPRQASCAAA